MNTELLSTRLHELETTWQDVLKQCEDQEVFLPGEVDTFADDLKECIKLAGEQTEGVVSWSVTEIWDRIWQRWPAKGQDTSTPDRRLAAFDFFIYLRDNGFLAHPPKPSGLSDEEIKRILNANTYEDLNDSRQGGYVTSSDHDAYDMGMLAGLRYARDHGYLSKEA